MTIKATNTGNKYFIENHNGFRRDMYFNSKGKILKYNTQYQFTKHAVTTYKTLNKCGVLYYMYLY